jgi:hypothetical protein
MMSANVVDLIYLMIYLGYIFSYQYLSAFLKILNCIALSLIPNYPKTASLTGGYPITPSQRSTLSVF